MTISDAGWYVVHTHVHAETKAASHLTRQGYAIYLPRYLKRRRHARRVEIIAAPLFPRYLFVAIEQVTKRWRSIQSTIGVTHLVRNGDEPAEVSACIVDGLRDREDERGFIRLDVRPRFAPGDKVRIAYGAFSACFGLFEGLTDNDRVAILLDLLGRKVRVTLKADSIVAA
jgi:transcriptional antiterminator RfaH